MLLDELLQKIPSEVEANSKDGAKRLSDFRGAFQQRFPAMNMDFGLADLFTRLLFERALKIFYLGLDASVFVELYSTLESLHLTFLPRMLARDEKSAVIIAKLISRKTLPEFAEISHQLGIWNEQDLKFANKLTKIRNGIAHKNEELVSKYLGSGRDQVNDASAWADQKDSLPHFIESISLVTKWMRELPHISADVREWKF